MQRNLSNLINYPVTVQPRISVLGVFKPEGLASAKAADGREDFFVNVRGTVETLNVIIRVRTLKAMDT
jgi:hypothetical protein